MPGTQSDHRVLHFNTVADCREEVRRILAAEEAGQLQSTGNWTAGQNLSHVAAWIEYAYEGFPVKPPPFFVRWILRWQLPKMLKSSMPRGVKIPGVPGGTTGMDDVPVDQAGARLLAALDRLESNENAPYTSPAFGDMSHVDRVQLNLRHAELHLGFLSYPEN
ncbi:MAG: DUF1569 domain-containing protein [Planctomycetaceae bacterium]|nr:DUF1569 domain-containing protein [Planctomycetaceae bacterium]